MNILSLSFYYHDSAAALVQDGRLVAAAEEERFSRVKHDSGFPGLAIDFVLRMGGITIHDVDYVVFYEKPFVKFERMLLSAMATFPRSAAVFRESMQRWISDKLWIKSMMAKRLSIPSSTASRSRAICTTRRLPRVEVSRTPSSSSQASFQTAWIPRMNAARSSAALPQAMPPCHRRAPSATSASS